MHMGQKEDPLRTLAVVLVGIVPAMLQFYRSGDTSSLVITGFLFILLSVYFIYEHGRNEIRRIEGRIEMLEKTKKGTIDPRNVILILLIFVLRLFRKAPDFSEFGGAPP